MTTLALMLAVTAAALVLCLRSQATVLLGGGVTDIRGSIGGTTFARNAGGNYIRARMKPTNKRSALQTARRAQVSYLTKEWSATLTDTQRGDWRAYAAGTTWTNRLGQTIEINGLAAFLRLNALLTMIGQTYRPAAPLAMGHAGGVTITFDAENDTTNIELDEPGGSFDKDTDDHHLAIFQALPVEAGVVHGTKGFRYIGVTSGDSAAPPSYPVDIAAAYTMVAGQIITCRAMFIDQNFRVSGPTEFSEPAAPSI